MSTDANETVEFAGPTSDGWYRTQIPDWIALNPDLKDGSYRLYCILRALVLEKQKNKIRVLSHEQIAFLAVGKNGKPSSVSTVKALLANLQEVGLVTNPDGSRIVTSSGPGTIQSRRRYQLADWPKEQSDYTGWRNAFDKLDAFTDNWRETRTDVSPGRIEGQKSDLDSQKSDEDGQKTDVDGQKSGENLAPTSDDAPSLKELPEGGALISSSPAEVEDITTDVVPEATTKKTKITRKSPEDIVLERLAHMNPTLEEAPAVVALVIHKAAVNGTRVEQPDRWIRGRDERVLEQDLEDVRRRSSKPGADVCKLHSVSLESGSCSSCMGDIKAGDADTIRAHLLEVGGDSRPDLVAVLGTPQVSAHTSGGGWSWESQMRGERRHRNNVVGGTRHGVEGQATYDAMAQMTQDELRALMLG